LTLQFYQIYSRSFKDNDNDGISKLPHLAETGVTAFWLSSVLESPQVDFGYDISDFVKVDPIFGTNEDLYELFMKAQNLGIRVIMDFVIQSSFGLQKNNHS
jgi:glycosidase